MEAARSSGSKCWAAAAEGEEGVPPISTAALLLLWRCCCCCEPNPLFALDLWDFSLAFLALFAMLESTTEAMPLCLSFSFSFSPLSSATIFRIDNFWICRSRAQMRLSRSATASRNSAASTTALRRPFQRWRRPKTNAQIQAKVR